MNTHTILVTLLLGRAEARKEAPSSPILQESRLVLKREWVRYSESQVSVAYSRKVMEFPGCLISFNFASNRSIEVNFRREINEDEGTLFIIKFVHRRSECTHVCAPYLPWISTYLLFDKGQTLL